MPVGSHDQSPLMALLCVGLTIGMLFVACLINDRDAQTGEWQQLQVVAADVARQESGNQCKWVIPVRRDRVFLPPVNLTVDCAVLEPTKIKKGMSLTLHKDKNGRAYAVE